MMTMDPSKGGRVLQGVGLASSHCHAQLSSDPAFAERAAKFSPFANGLNAQHSHSYEVGKNRERSGAGDGTGDGKLSSSNPSFSAFVGTIIENPHGLKAKAPGIMLGDIATLCDGKKLNSNEVGCDGHDLDVSTLPTVEAFEGATGIILSRNGYEEGDCHEDSSCSEQDGAVAKRKGPVEAKRKDSPDRKVFDSDELKAKRYKAGEAMREGDDVKCKAERSASEQSGDSSPRSLRANSKPPEPPKQDYIHVRARRGQATDSHSLAERVRREKISERMKFLQDLVPGCSKVTGKAVMLDEIINYVQSLQRQIEFLSMKLAAVNPRLDVNLDNFLNKEVMQSRSPETILMGPEHSLGYGHVQADRQSPSQLSHPSSWDFRTLGMASEALLRRSSSSPISGHVTRMDDFCEPLSQLSSVWDGDLQSIVQMGFNQGRSGFFSQGLSGPGLIPTRHMKVEL